MLTNRWLDGQADQRTYAEQMTRLTLGARSQQVVAQLQDLFGPGPSLVALVSQITEPVL